ncbi:MAG: hypothetical protein ACKVS8_05070 [Phycisphaerales bacterium]
MLRKRGTPAFIELLRGGVSVVPGGGGVGGRGVGGGGGTRPVVVDPKPVVRVVPVARPADRPAERGGAQVVAGVPGRPIPVYEPSGKPVPAVAEVEDSEAGGMAGVGGVGLPRGWLYAAAAGVVVLSLVWVVAFKVGESSGVREGNERVARLVQGGGGAENAGKTTTGAGSAIVATDPLLRTEKAPAPAPTPAPPVNVPVPATVKTSESGAVLGFQAGLNYLVVATLRRADADEAAKYLSAQGLAVMILPERGIDPNSAQAASVSWEVLILRGYSSPLSATQAERDALEAQVKSLGRRWKAENRKAPTDFAQVFWKRFKGP